MTFFGHATKRYVVSFFMIVGDPAKEENLSIEHFKKNESSAVKFICLYNTDSVEMEDKSLKIEEVKS